MLTTRRTSRASSRHLTIVLPLADYRVYAAAARRLRCRLGHMAPDVVVLIQHELSNRDVSLVVDDYLHACARRSTSELLGAGSLASRPSNQSEPA